MREGVSGTTKKDTRTKPRGVKSEEGRGDGWGVRGNDGGGMQTTILEQQ